MENELRDMLIRIEERLEFYEKRITTLEEDRSAIADLSRNLAEMNVQQNHLISKLDALNAKVDELEKRPVKRWDSLITALISAIAGIAIGFFLK